MRVVVGDAMSKEKAVLSGVPQGSVIGPLLFLLFINDLPETIKGVIKIFADDVKMVVNPTKLPDIESDLIELCMWESKWLLKFNLDNVLLCMSVTQILDMSIVSIVFNKIFTKRGEGGYPTQGVQLPFYV